MKRNNYFDDLKTPLWDAGKNLKNKNLKAIWKCLVILDDLKIINGMDLVLKAGMFAMSIENLTNDSNNFEMCYWRYLHSIIKTYHNKIPMNKYKGIIRTTFKEWESSELSQTFNEDFNLLKSVD